MGEQGNRRACVGDLFLARADGSPQRFYSLSAQIQRERKDYYDVLERTQKGTLDAVLVKARFWQRWALTEQGRPLNERQVRLLNRLLDGFEGRLTSSKWAAIAKCSPDTVLRDITQLLERGVLKKSPGGESFVALSTGLQAALWCLGAAPGEVAHPALS